MFKKETPQNKNFLVGILVGSTLGASTAIWSGTKQCKKVQKELMKKYNAFKKDAEAIVKPLAKKAQKEVVKPIAKKRKAVAKTAAKTRKKAVKRVKRAKTAVRRKTRR